MKNHNAHVARPNGASSVPTARRVPGWAVRAEARKASLGECQAGPGTGRQQQTRLASRRPTSLSLHHHRIRSRATAANSCQPARLDTPLSSSPRRASPAAPPSPIAGSYRALVSIFPSAPLHTNSTMAPRRSLAPLASLALSASLLFGSSVGAQLANTIQIVGDSGVSAQQVRHWLTSRARAVPRPRRRLPRAAG